MDVGGRRAGGARSSVVPGSVWESRMKSDEVKGGMKVFNGEESPEEGGDGRTRLRRIPNGKRKTWKSETSEGFDRNLILVARRRSSESIKNCDEQLNKGLSVSLDGIKKSPILTRKISSSAEKFERSPMRKLRSESAEEPETNSKQLKKSKESINQNVEDVIDESKNKTDGVCKDFGSCQEKVISGRSENVGMVKNHPELSVKVGGDIIADIDDEGDERVEVDEDEIKMEKENVKENNVSELKVVNEQQHKKVLIQRRFQHDERPVSILCTATQSSPIKRHSTSYDNFRKSHSIPKAEKHHGFPRTQNKLQSLGDDLSTFHNHGSIVTDSPVNSSSSDDFIAYLDSALDATSPDATPSSEEVENKDESETVRIKRCRVEGIEKTQGSTSQGFVEESLEMSAKEDVCTHPGSFGDMCIRCGQKLDGEFGVTFGYIHKGLRLYDEEISRLRDTDMKNFLRLKKLYLVLDLDHTLLNSTQLFDLNSGEVYLLNQADSLADVSKGSLFKLDYMHMMTKLRPFVRTFLKEASEMFEMYIYTMGDRAYALEMAKLLDPNGEYFHSKVISRDDGTQKHQKGLDIVLGQESAVLILDDTENAWMKHKDNLILMERYHFFASSCRQFGFNCQSLAESKSDECESDGALSRVLNVLKQAHHTFFNELKDDLGDRDVRQVLKTLKSEVLKGCVLVFSRIVHAMLPALRRMAEQMGATCLTEVDSSVTHVVATDMGTEKARWATKEKKFLVHPRWIEAANYFWQKQPEDNFTLKKKQ